MTTIEPELVAAYSGYIDLGEECIVRLADHHRAGADLPDMSPGLFRLVRKLARPKPTRIAMWACAAAVAIAAMLPLAATAADYPAPSGDLDHSNGGVMVYEYAGECLRVTPRRAGVGANTVTATNFAALMDALRSGHPIFAASVVPCARYHALLDQWDMTETPWVLIKAGVWGGIAADGGSVMYPMHHHAASQ